MRQTLPMIFGGYTKIARFLREIYKNGFTAHVELTPVKLEFNNLFSFEKNWVLRLCLWPETTRSFYDCYGRFSAPLGYITLSLG